MYIVLLKMFKIIDKIVIRIYTMNENNTTVISS